MARRFLVLAFVVIAASMSGSASSSTADFSGTWVGTIAIPEPGMRFNKRPIRVELTHKGSKLTGVLSSSPTERVPIQAGLVQVTQFGTSISFELKEGELILRVELRPDEGVLRGAARIDGVRATAPIELRRAPAADKTTTPG